MIQAETYNIPSYLEAIRKWRNQLQDIGFDRPRYGSISIGTYSTGQIGFLTAHAHVGGGSKQEESGNTCDDNMYRMDVLPGVKWSKILSQFNNMNGTTLYYHPRVHRSSFDLPLWVEKSIYGSDVCA